MKFVSTVSVALLVALASCKPPTAPTKGQAATLTLILPDSARALDTVIFHARYSDSIKSSWKFEWQFGDSTRATTTDTSIAHVYDSAGTYTVQVTLADSAAKSIAKQSAELQVLPLNPPTLTLTVPDTVFWGDSCVMRVSSSEPLRSTWKYTWSFGDSATAASRQSSVLHWYVSPGVYTIRAELEDTSNLLTFSSRIDSVHVVARHFDLSLLQSMPYVELTWNTQRSGPSHSTVCGDVELYLVKPLVWMEKKFSMDSTITYDTGGPYWTDDENLSNKFSGAVDSALTEVTSFSHSMLADIYMKNDHTGQNGSCSSAGLFKVESVPFVGGADSELRFEAHGNLIKNAFYQYSFSSDTSYDDWMNPPDSAFVIIRFHK